MKILFPKKSRELAFKKISNSQAPRDFFYGSISSSNFNIEKMIVDTRPSIKDFCIPFYSKLFNRILRNNFSQQKAKYLFRLIPNNSKVISFTDWDSLNIALYKNFREDLKLICGFHGLFNFYQRTPESILFNKKELFLKAINKMHHIFFFGEEDREKCIKFFKISRNKTSLYRFGVDIDFWKNEPINQTIDVLSVGSDLNRNYNIFEKFDVDFNLSIITKLNVKKLKNKANILAGSKNNPYLTDNQIKNFYNKSKIIVIPLRETLQPSGYSVTLQAMACEKPVIMTNIKGLWDKEIFKNMKNIIFVSPNDPISLEKAIKLLLKDSNLRDLIGKEAKKTAHDFFSLKRMNEDFKKLTLL